MITPVRILGLVILALGITFLIMGLNASDTFADRFMKEMAGKYPEETKWYIFGGVTMIAVGLGIIGVNFFKKNR